MMYVLLIIGLLSLGLGLKMHRLRHNRKKEVLTGRLQVTGRDEAEVLFDGRATHVHVKFEDDHNNVPCNPGSTDNLEWCLDEKHHETMLKIKWDVSGSRLICWEIHFK